MADLSVLSRRLGAAPATWIDQGIFLGLLGEPRDAREAFDRYLALDDDRDWARVEQAETRAARELLDDREAFTGYVTDRVLSGRRLMKLDPAIPFTFWT